MVEVIVAIAHGHEAVLYEQYEEQLTGQFCRDFVWEHFEYAFENSSNPWGKSFLQDGNSSQNFLKAKNSLFSVGAWMFPIAPRSPDITQLKLFPSGEKTIE